MDEAAELGWPSLTSIPLSCWSPLSNLPQSITDTDTAVMEGRLMDDTTGADAALGMRTDDDDRVTTGEVEFGMALDTVLHIGPTVAAKLIGLVQALTVGGGAGVRETTVATVVEVRPDAESLGSNTCETPGEVMVVVIGVTLIVSPPVTALIRFYF